VTTLVVTGHVTVQVCVHAMHGEIFTTCKERTRRGVATHSVAVQLLDFQPLLLDIPDEHAEHASGGQAPVTTPNGRSCTFMDEPLRLQTLLTQAWPQAIDMSPRLRIGSHASCLLGICRKTAIVAALIGP